MSDFHDRKPIACACGNHVFVAITRGYTTMVSPEDAALLTERRWQAEPHHGRIRVRKKSAAGRNVNLGAAVLGIDPLSGLLPDHINLDPTDNRRTNLREATNTQNVRNRQGRAGRGIPKGVFERGGKFQARIRAGGRSLYLGTFDTAIAAHAAYVAAATKLHGEFARAA